VAQLDELIGTSRAAGMAVSWEVVGEVEPAAATVGLTLYRILQEALANAARHGSGGAVSVRLVADPARLLLTIHNAVPDIEDDGAVPVDGHGIDGMRRRAAAIGGSVDTGVADGQFVLTAVLPRAATASTPPFV
jgi:signal transduction histidine kinase